jgi:hypothetical protein
MGQSPPCESSSRPPQPPQAQIDDGYGAALRAVLELTMEEASENVLYSSKV